MILQADSIVKEYRIPGEKPLRVLDGVSFSVATGERVAIVGKSGSGKTTLLNILGGLDAPTAGNVTICGTPLFGGLFAGARRNRLRATTIGFVFQNFQLMDELDIVENVMLPIHAGVASAPFFSRRDAETSETQSDEALSLREKKGSPRARAIELLEKVGLSGRLAHLPKELSGGEQQRVAIARALMRRPAIVFADEPTGNLDSTTGAEILKLLLSLRDQDTAVVMVTHSAEAASLCDRTLKLENGRLQQPQSEQTA